MSEMLFRSVGAGGGGLSPLPPEKAHEIRVTRVAGYFIAVTNGLLGFAPLTGRNVLGVIVDAPEVEPRAVAGKITSIRGRVGAFALQQRQAKDEGIPRPTGMDVKVAKENLRRGFRRRSLREALGDSSGLRIGREGPGYRGHRPSALEPPAKTF